MLIFCFIWSPCFKHHFKHLTHNLNTGNYCVYWCHYDHWCIHSQYRHSFSSKNNHFAWLQLQNFKEVRKQNFQHLLLSNYSNSLDKILLSYAFYYQYGESRFYNPRQTTSCFMPLLSCSYELKYWLCRHEYILSAKQSIILTVCCNSFQLLLKK